jgi:hypothetical protein
MADAKKLGTSAVDAYVHDLEQALDPGRLASYYPPGGDKLAMVTTYFWNVALCKELYLSLGTVEVTLRNAIHDTLTAKFQAPDWYDDPALILLEREKKAIGAAKKEIAFAKRPVIPGRVVAGVTFGFWTNLLSAPYGDSPRATPLWTPNDAELIRSAFPHLPLTRQNRSHVHGRFNAIRALRNRVVHHEPIWKGVRMQSGKVVPLAGLYNDMLEAIGWVSPNIRASIVAIDRFPSALHHGYAAIESDMKAYLKIK